MKTFKQQCEEKLKKHLVDDNNITHGEVISCGFENTNLLTGKVALPYYIKYIHKAKTGRETTKKKVVYFTPSYCPFTGDKLSS